MRRGDAADVRGGDEVGDRDRDSKRKKKRSRSRSRRRRRRSTSSSDSSAAEMDFRLAGTSAGKMGNRIRRLATKRPGKLWAVGIAKMREHLDPALVASAGAPSGVPASEGGNYPPPGATAYILQVMRDTSHNMRNERELRTLGAALDMLSKGQIYAAGDYLMQRLKAVEMAVSDGHWRTATHVELLPSAVASASTVQEREAACNLEAATEKYRRGTSSGGVAGGAWSREETY